MEDLHVPPPALESKNKKILDFSPATSWAKCYDIHNVPHQPARQRTALELRLMGLAPEPKGPPRGPGSTNPLGTTSSAASSSTSPSSSSSGLALYLSHASGPERLSSRPPSYTSTPHQLPPHSKMVDQNSYKLIPRKAICEQKFLGGIVIGRKIIWGGGNVRNAQVWWRTTGRVG